MGEFPPGGASGSCGHAGIGSDPLGNIAEALGGINSRIMRSDSDSEPETRSSGHRLLDGPGAGAWASADAAASSRIVPRNKTIAYDVMAISS
jgi:hypothetical protein